MIGWPEKNPWLFSFSRRKFWNFLRHKTISYRRLETFEGRYLVSVKGSLNRFISSCCETHILWRAIETHRLLATTRRHHFIIESLRPNESLTSWREDINSRSLLDWQGFVWLMNLVLNFQRLRRECRSFQSTCFSRLLDTIYEITFTWS